MQENGVITFGTNFYELSAEEIKYLSLQKLLRSAIIKNTVEGIS